MSRASRWSGWVLVLLGSAWVVGCAGPSRRTQDIAPAAWSASRPTSDSRPVKPAVAQQSGPFIPATEELRPGMPALVPVASQLSGPHPVEDHVAYALSQNPRIQASRQRVEAMANRVPQARSLDDPMLSVMGFPFFPNVPQTASGRATVGITASQEFPWIGKLRLRGEAAEAEVQMALAQFAAVELEVIEGVKRAYYELYYLQQAIRITEENRRLLDDLAEIARINYENRKVPYQDVLRVQVEVANLEAELVRLRQELTSARARLARLLHVSPETALEAEAELPPEELPRDLQRLYEQAVAARPELQARLAAIERDRTKVELAQLGYFPDLTFGVGWKEMTTSRALALTADGEDDVSLELMANIPIYRNRLKAAVREAEAQTSASARDYDALRDQTMEEVADLFAQLTSQAELLRLFREQIIPRAEQTLEVSIKAYRVGEVDFLQLIDNWQQLLRFQVMRYRLESQLRQSLAALERILGSTRNGFPTADSRPAVPADTAPS